MAGVCLVVHETSIPYVKNVLAAIADALKDAFGCECPMIACSSIDSAETMDVEYIFIIGENLGRFTRKPGRRYIFINFSVVSKLGSLASNSLNGSKLIRYKSQLLQSKLDLFDAVMDYYPPQTRYLSKTLNTPVFGFVPWVAPCAGLKPIPLESRAYDVCFVGSLSKRRQRVLDKLKAEGCVLSPFSNVVAEEVSAQSRCTLNIHLERSNHLEIPRVMGALAQSPLITESSYGIYELIPKQLVQVHSYSNLVNQTLALLSNPKSLEETALRARNWYIEVAAPRYKDMFISAVNELRFTLKVTRASKQVDSLSVE